ncbi:hypothetical protein HOLleu_09595 [Holothuria leucospilota]|uniref:Uncharacterized protein n=1 Tax=Holothuria leucospilota TaxID=206669 RepID=A0A9Q1HE88_HOLLE|nr:hypothetical protein HOLleu_09595 [Holothuria leucospilota]
MGNFDMQKQYQKAITDLQNDFHSFRNVVTNAEENEGVRVPVERVCRAGVGVSFLNICCPCFRKKSKPPEQPHCHLEPEVQEAMQLFGKYSFLLH